MRIAKLFPVRVHFLQCGCTDTAYCCSALLYCSCTASTPTCCTVETLHGKCSCTQHLSTQHQSQVCHCAKKAPSIGTRSWPNLLSASDASSTVLAPARTTFFFTPTLFYGKVILEQASKTHLVNPFMTALPESKVRYYPPRFSQIPPPLDAKRCQHSSRDRIANFLFSLQFPIDFGLQRKSD